ncbi:MAG: sugar ABC transporter ATP-binding protein [Thermomicrobiales bacterium]
MNQGDDGIALAVDSLSKQFPGVVALDGVDLTLREHEVLGLVGENGAGKSTLMKVLAGVYQPDAGTVRLRGVTIRPQSVRQAVGHGVAMVFQEQSLLPNITVAENLFLGNEDQFMRCGVMVWGKMHKAAATQLAKVEVELGPRTYTGDLSFAQRQMVELAKAMTIEDRTRANPIILLDEPTSVLAQAEIDRLFRIVRRLRARASFVFVSHRLDEVLALSDRIYVMKDGRVVAERLPGATDTAELHRLMVGRDRNSEYYRESDQVAYDPNAVVLGVDRLTAVGHFRDVSFEVHRGEVVALCGVVGSGREGVCRALAGALVPDGGDLLIGGRRMRFRSPRAAVGHGVAYVPMERRVEGVVPYFTIASNITLPDLSPIRRFGFLNLRRENRRGQEWIDRLGIRAPGPQTITANLSGGNQQKVVLAKWLSNHPQVLVLDHPTRGLDVGAKEDVYALIREVSRQGVAVVLTSDTLDEAIGLSHTLLVMKDGRVVKRFDGNGGKPAQVDVVGHML